jgi:site-specific DNA-cytosine methylase
MWKVYLLQEIEGNKTYVGATVDIHRRLLQHNQVQSGGAKATHGTIADLQLFTQVHNCDVPTFRFPCQPYSHAGLRQGMHDEFRSVLMTVVNEIDSQGTYLK